MAAKREHLHVVDDAGELQDLCQNPACIALREELRGEKTEKRSWRAKYYRAIEDKEAKAKAHDLWPAAVELFTYWKERTGHKRAKWTPDRFWVVERFLREDGMNECRWAINGLLRSDFHQERGYDEFERPFSPSQSRSAQANFEYFNQRGRPSNAEFWEWYDALPGAAA